MSEREQNPSTTSEHNERPFGRFLLSQVTESDGERLWLRGAYAYVRNFATEYNDQLRPNGSTFITSAEVGDDGDISIPRGVPSYVRAVWLEFVQSSNTPDSYTWRVNSGTDEYDLDLNGNGCVLTKCELDVQGSVLRRSTVADPNVIEGLQTLIEAVITEAHIDEKVTEHREQCMQDFQAYKVMNDRISLSLREQKEKSALKRRANEPLFHSGSLGHRHKRPLF